MLCRYKIYDDAVACNDSPADQRSNRVNGVLNSLPSVTMTTSTAVTEAAGAVTSETADMTTAPSTR